MWDQSMLHRPRNSGRVFWWNQLPCGPVLTPISCTKLKIHSVHTDSPIVPKQIFLSSAGNLDEGPVYASQIKKLRKRFLVEPAPLWSSSYTHLLYKAHDPFNAWTQSNCSLNKVFYYLVLEIWMRDPLMVHRSSNSGRDFWWNQLPCGPALTPISCTKFKIHSAHEHSPIVPKQTCRYPWQHC